MQSYKFMEGYLFLDFFVSFLDFFCFSWLLASVASGFCGFWLLWLLAFVAFGFRGFCGFCGFWLLWLLVFWPIHLSVYTYLNMFQVWQAWVNMYSLLP